MEGKEKVGREKCREIERLWRRVYSVKGELKNKNVLFLGERFGLVGVLFFKYGG